MSLALNNSTCTKCTLCTQRKRVLNGSGNPQARIMFVTDTANTFEESKGQFIQGLTGELFDVLLSRVGINRSEVFITGVVRCAGTLDKKNLQPSVDACLDYLDQEIASVRPNVIVPLGSIALRSIMRSKILNITKERGIVQYSDRYKCKILPIFHPAYIMKMPQYEKIVVSDLKHALQESSSPELLVGTVRDHKTLIDFSEFMKVMAEYNQATELAADVESTGADWQKDVIIGISFSKKCNESVYIPLVKGEGDMNPFWDERQAEVVEQIKKLLENNSRKIFHNGPYDIKILRKNMGIQVQNFAFDTMVADHLLDENAERLHSLENCALRHTDFGAYKQPVMKWFKAKRIAENKRNFNLLPNDLLFVYAANDADCTFTLYTLFKPQLVANGLLRLFSQVIMPVQKELIETEYRGVEIDTTYLDQLEIKFDTQLQDLEQQIYQLVGTFKITSARALQKILFQDLGLIPTKKTKGGGWSTDKEVLKELKGKHPVIDLIRDFKLTTKLQSTYVRGLRGKLDELGRLHTNYKVTGTTTGRLSSSGPNLQNIPARTNDVQNMFIAGKDRVFIAADYSQAEFRVWAQFSQDPQMLADISRGRDFDIHKTIASIVFGIKHEQVTKDQRNLAKTVVFGGIYGRGIPSIAEQFKVPVYEAERILNFVKRRYPEGFRWIVRQQQLAQHQGFVKNAFGRIRHLGAALQSFDKAVQSTAMRQSVNSPVQGTIGDLTSIATVRTLSRFRRESLDGYLALTIHDALIFSVPSAQQNIAIDVIKEEMERPVEGLTVPMVVELKVGARWGDVHTIEDEVADTDFDPEDLEEDAE